MTSTCAIVTSQRNISGVVGSQRLTSVEQTTLDGLYLVAMVYHLSPHSAGSASQSHQSHRVQNVRGFSCHYSIGCWLTTQTPQLDLIGLWRFAFNDECGIERRERPTLTTCGWPVYVTGVLYSTPGLHAQWAMNRPTYIVPLHVKRVRVRVTRAHRMKRSFGVVTSQVRSSVRGNLSTLHRQIMTGGRKPQSAPSTDENLS